MRASIAIQGSDQPVPGEASGSPLANQLAGEQVDDDARCYELVLPEVERLLTRTDDYESLWRGAWEKIATAMESFERGQSTVQEFPDSGFSLVTLAPEVFSSSGFDPTRHAAPYTAISRYAEGQLFLITTPLDSGWVYRIDYPYYSWAETVVRPRIPRRDLSTLLHELNRHEAERSGPGSADGQPGWGGGAWKSDTSELASAIKFLGEHGKLAASRLPPDEVAKIVGVEMTSRPDAKAAR